MKNGWQTMKLGDVCDFEGGSQPPKSEFIYEEKPGYVRFLQIRDFGSDKNITYIRQSKKNRLCNENDILIGRYGASVGKILTDKSGAYNVALMKTIPNLEVLDHSWFYNYLISDEFQKPLLNVADRSAQAGFSKDDIYNFPVPVPPIAEQQRIVGLLDEAFAGIATAKANSQKNLQNTRALFESHLQSVFTQRVENGAEKTSTKPKKRLDGRQIEATAIDDAELARLNAGYVTKTGGRDATLRHIPGKLSLAVGMPSTGARDRWGWAALTDLARLESGHTPSRKHPEYWGGSVAWIGIQDARENHGKRITDTIQKTNELGIANSSARVLPENTVCLSRTASVGYVVVMGRPMATSQDFVNWVCSPKLVPDFLKYLFLAERREGLLRFASGAVHQTIYFPEAKAFHICYPDADEQRRIVQQCDILAEETQRLATLYERKLAALEALKKSLLHQAFTGEL